MELRNHPLVRPLKPALGPPVRLARRIAGRVRGRLWRLSPDTWARTWRWARGVAAEIRRRRVEERLTVAVDVLPLWEPRTGIGWYLYKLLEEWAGRDDARFRLYGLTMVRAPGIPGPATALPTGPALEWVTFEVPDDLLLGQRWLVPLVRKLEPWLLAADRNDVVFAPNYILPPPFAVVAARTPVVATVHDLSVRRVPWAVRPDTRVALTERLDRALYEARLVLTPTAAIGRELTALAGVEPATVRVVYEGPGQAREVAAGEAAGGLAEPAPPAGTPRRFALFVGTLEPRKNVTGLIAAWRRLRRLLPDAPTLGLVGRFGWSAGEIRSAVEEAAAEGWLHHFGYVSHGELLALYRRAEVVVLPSFYEGFGLPAVEAMHAARPLVLSDVPVLREVGGDAALYAPPRCPDLLARQLARVLSDPAFAADLARRGRRRAGLFTWGSCAAGSLAVLREAAGRTSGG